MATKLKARLSLVVLAIIFVLAFGLVIAATPALTASAEWVNFDRGEYHEYDTDHYDYNVSLDGDDRYVIARFGGADYDFKHMPYIEVSRDTNLYGTTIEIYEDGEHNSDITTNYTVHWAIFSGKQWGVGDDSSLLYIDDQYDGSEKLPIGDYTLVVSLRPFGNEFFEAICPIFFSVYDAYGPIRVYDDISYTWQGKTIHETLKMMVDNSTDTVFFDAAGHVDGTDYPASVSLAVYPYDEENIFPDVSPIDGLTYISGYWENYSQSSDAYLPVGKYVLNVMCEESVNYAELNAKEVGVVFEVLPRAVELYISYEENQFNKQYGDEINYGMPEPIPAGADITFGWMYNDGSEDGAFLPSGEDLIPGTYSMWGVLGGDDAANCTLSVISNGTRISKAGNHIELNIGKKTDTLALTESVHFAYDPIYSDAITYVFMDVTESAVSGMKPSGFSSWCAPYWYYMDGDVKRDFGFTTDVDTYDLYLELRGPKAEYVDLTVTLDGAPFTLGESTVEVTVDPYELTELKVAYKTGEEDCVPLTMYGSTETQNYLYYVPEGFPLVVYSDKIFSEERFTAVTIDGWKLNGEGDTLTTIGNECTFGTNAYYLVGFTSNSRNYTIGTLAKPNCKIVVAQRTLSVMVDTNVSYTGETVSPKATINFAAGNPGEMLVTEDLLDLFTLYNVSETSVERGFGYTYGFALKDTTNYVITASGAKDADATKAYWEYEITTNIATVDWDKVEDYWYYKEIFPMIGSTVDVSYLSKKLSWTITTNSIEADRVTVNADAWEWKVNSGEYKNLKTNPPSVYDLAGIGDTLYFRMYTNDSASGNYVGSSYETSFTIAAAPVFISPTEEQVNFTYDATNHQIVYWEFLVELYRRGSGIDAFVRDTDAFGTGNTAMDAPMDYEEYLAWAAEHPQERIDFDHWFRVYGTMEAHYVGRYFIDIDFNSDHFMNSENYSLQTSRVVYDVNYSEVKTESFDITAEFTYGGSDGSSYYQKPELNFTGKYLDGEVKDLAEADPVIGAATFTPALASDKWYNKIPYSVVWEYNNVEADYDGEWTTWTNETYPKDAATYYVRVTCLFAELKTGEYWTGEGDSYAWDADAGNWYVKENGAWTGRKTYRAIFTGSFVINPKEVTVDWGTTSVTYDGENHTLTPTVTGLCYGEAIGVGFGGYVNEGEQINYKEGGYPYSIAAKVNAIGVATSSALTNYTITSGANTVLNINKRVVTLNYFFDEEVEANNLLSVTYDNKDHALDHVNVTNVANSDDVSIALSGAGNTGKLVADKPAVTLTLTGSTAGNYTFEGGSDTKDVEWSIAKRNIAFTIGDDSMTYGGTANYVGLITVWSGSLADGDALSDVAFIYTANGAGSLTITGATSAGRYYLIPSTYGCAKTANYNVTFFSTNSHEVTISAVTYNCGYYTVNPKELKVRFYNTQKVWNNAAQNPDFAFDVAGYGIVNADKDLESEREDKADLAKITLDFYGGGTSGNQHWNKQFRLDGTSAANYTLVANGERKTEGADKYDGQYDAPELSGEYYWSTVNFLITARTVTFTTALTGDGDGDLRVTYDGLSHALSATLGDGVRVRGGDDDLRIDITNRINTNAGEYTATLTLKGDDVNTGKYLFANGTTSTTVNYYIDKFAVTITYVGAADTYSYNYGDATTFAAFRTAVDSLSGLFNWTALPDNSGNQITDLVKFRFNTAANKSGTGYDNGDFANASSKNVGKYYFVVETNTDTSSDVRNNYDVTLFVNDGSKYLSVEKGTPAFLKAPTAANPAFTGASIALLKAEAEGPAGSTIEYRAKDGESWLGDWTTTYSEVVATSVKTYYVYYRFAETDNWNAVAESEDNKIEAKIAAISATLKTTPTAKTGLTFSTFGLDLANAGTTDDGVVKYSLDNANWSATIPQGINATTYTVYYMVEGDSDHSDATDDDWHFEVTIAPYEVELTITDPDMVYDGNAKEVVEVVYTDLTSSEVKYSLNHAAFAISYSAEERTNWTGKSFTVTISLTDTNYTVKGGSTEKNYQVQKAEIKNIVLTQTDVDKFIYSGVAMQPTFGTRDADRAGNQELTFLFNTVADKNAEGWSTEIPTAYTNVGDTATNVLYFYVTAPNHYDTMVNSRGVTITPKELTVTWYVGDDEVTGVTSTTSPYTVNYNGSQFHYVASAVASGTIGGDKVTLQYVEDSELDKTFYKASGDHTYKARVKEILYTAEGSDFANYMVTDANDNEDLIWKIDQIEVTAVWGQTLIPAAEYDNGNHDAPFYGSFENGSFVYNGQAQGPSVQLSGIIDGDPISFYWDSNSSLVENHKRIDAFNGIQKVGRINLQGLQAAISSYKWADDAVRSVYFSIVPKPVTVVYTESEHLSVVYGDEAYWDNVGNPYDYLSVLDGEGKAIATGDDVTDIVALNFTDSKNNAVSLASLAEQNYKLPVEKYKMAVTTVGNGNYLVKLALTEVEKENWEGAYPVNSDDEAYLEVTPREVYVKYSGKHAEIVYGDKTAWASYLEDMADVNAFMSIVMTVENEEVNGLVGDDKLSDLVLIQLWDSDNEVVTLANTLGNGYYHWVAVNKGNSNYVILNDIEEDQQVAVVEFNSDAEIYVAPAPIINTITIQKSTVYGTAYKAPVYGDGIVVDEATWRFEGEEALLTAENAKDHVGVMYAPVAADATEEEIADLLEDPEAWSLDVPTLAGKYLILVGIFGIDNYDNVYFSDSFVIENADLTDVSVAQVGTLTYNGKAQTATVDARATAVNDQAWTFTYSLTENGAYTTAVPPLKNWAKNGYTVYYKVNAANHNEATGSFVVTINKKAVEITIDAKTSVYGDAQVALTATDVNKGIVDDDAYEAGKTPLPYALACVVTATSAVGKYDITGSIVNPNYDITFKNQADAYEVTKKAIDVTVENKTSVYGSAQVALTATVAEGALVGEDKNDDTLYTLACVVTATSAVGKYDITGTAVNPNYDITFKNEADAYVVTNATLTAIKVTAATLTYDKTAQASVASAEASAVNDQKVTFTYATDKNGTYAATVPTFVNAGSYTVYYKASAANHDEVAGEVKVTVAKKAITVTAEAKASDYKDDLAALTVAEDYLTVTNGNVYAIDGDLVATIATNADNTKISSATNVYAITVTVVANDNYDVTATNATYTVNAKITPAKPAEEGQEPSTEEIKTQVESISAEEIAEKTESGEGVSIKDQLDNVKAVIDAVPESKVESITFQLGAADEESETPVPTITFSLEAIKQLTENEDVKITYKETKAADVDKTDKALKNAELVIEVSLGGAKFDNGTATISTAFENKAPNGKKAVVYFVDDNGKKTDMKATFADGKVTFKTSHFSTYVVEYVEVESGLSGGAIAGIVIGCVVGVAAIAVGVFFFLKKKGGKKAEASEENAEAKEEAKEESKEEAKEEAPVAEAAPAEGEDKKE